MLLKDRPCCNSQSRQYVEYSIITTRARYEADRHAVHSLLSVDDATRRCSNQLEPCSPWVSKLIKNASASLSILRQTERTKGGREGTKKTQEEVWATCLLSRLAGKASRKVWALHLRSDLRAQHRQNGIFLTKDCLRRPAVCESRELKRNACRVSFVLWLFMHLQTP